MPGIKDITNIWRNVGEVDLRPIREAALRPMKIAIVGQPGSGRHTVADQLRSDPHKPEVRTQTPVMVADLENAEGAARADLIIVLVDALVRTHEAERSLAQKWINSGGKVLIFVNLPDPLTNGRALEDSIDWPVGAVVYGSVSEPDSLLSQFVPAVLDLLPDRHLSLGRHFPLFRTQVATRLINETCFANAAYALSTGLAEAVPVLDVPLNVTDMIVLTKAQAFLVYKLGLELGFSTRWQDYVTEFSGVIGGGFLWRQLARQLVGLIPVWGIIPKVAVSYSGTYVVGNTILQWYHTGRHITPKQMREMYARAFTRGKAVAASLLQKAPHPKFGLPKIRRPRLGRGKATPLLAAEAGRVCDVCGKTSAPDATFCQYCAAPLKVGVGQAGPALDVTGSVQPGETETGETTHG